MATQIGDLGADTLTGGAEADILLGLAGNDRLTGGAGDDVLLGGDGNDRLYGQAGLDLLYGGAGNDYLDGWGVAQLSGEAGDDLLVWDPGAVLVRPGLIEENLFDGGSGTDTLRIVNNATEDYQSSSNEPLVEPAITRINLRGGDPEFAGGGEPIVTIGDFEVDEGAQLWGYVYDIEVFDLRGAETRGIFDGNDGRTTVLGTENRDVFRGNGGRDVLDGRGGNDFLFDGGLDTNVLRGGAGDDLLTVELDNVTTPINQDLFGELDGGTGFDTLDFRVTVRGDVPDQSESYRIDLYVGLSDTPDRFGFLTLEDVVMVGDSAGDQNRYAGFSDIERFDFSVSGENVFYQAFTDRDVTVIGSNSIFGDSFKDGAGDEVLSGRGGNDRFELAKGGADTVDGGTGDDTFVVGFSGAGSDTITGFEGAGAAGGDLIEWRLGSRRFTKDESDGATVFTWDGGSLTVGVIGLQEGQDYVFA
jgi:hypothetical protein